MAKYKRWFYFLFILLTIPAGLGTRIYASQIPMLVANYGGDVLYATFIFFAVRLLLIRYPLVKIGIISYLICITIETLQLYHAPWIELIRHTPPFGLILGYGFLWSDWICYLAGTLLGFFIAMLLEKKLFGIAESPGK